MPTLPAPVVLAALAAVIALPFSLAAAGTLAFTAALGAIIHADYPLRLRRVRRPSPRHVQRMTRTLRRGEPHQLAA